MPGPGEGIPKEILLVSPDRLGDLVWTLPALDHVRATYPSSRISFLASRYAGRLLEGHPAVDRLFFLERNTHSLGKFLHYRAFLWKWGRRPPDVLVLFKGGHLGRTFARRFRKHRVYSILDFPESRRKKDHPARLRLELVERFCGPYGREAWPEYHVPREDQARADARIAGMGLKPRRFLVLHPGANKLVRFRSILAPADARNSLKTWPLDRWKELARELGRLGIPALLTGGPPEGEACREVAREGKGRILSIAGGPDVRELAGILARARAVVVADTGPGHLAAAVGTPVVSLFGPTDPGASGPAAPAGRIRILRAGLPCSPCKDRPGVECRDNQCMRAIRADQVLTALEELDALP